MKKIIDTLHGTIQTPAFLPDATYGAIKSLSFEDVEATGTESLVTTTLHLEQKLDHRYIKEFGGLHKFFNWNKPILTDSGGYQVFSLIYRNPNKRNAITDAGCSFVDYTSGKYQLLTPEISQIIQFHLGADIVTVLDVPLRNDASTADMKEAIKRNTEWAKRSKDKFLELHQLTEKDFSDPKIKRPLIGAVIQGGNNFDLRKQSAEELQEIGFDLYNFGGPPIHKEKNWYQNAPKGFNRELLEFVANLLPQDSVKYAMGIGSPDDIIYSSQVGWDIFDTVLPTRNARHGYLYVSKGYGDKSYEHYDVVHIRSKRYEFDEQPIDPLTPCDITKNISRAYLRHLIRTKDPAGWRIASIHNLMFYQNMIKQLQK
ncbi:queuine tRNA-ribosyltransferase family protein [Candidatus Dojkabacteria bacterium]|uniref:Queuine tRNA-ribosyltransferase family protein n=1 Tax=Candidatus Dojkabacteria bacterium TaxID=2099670 RepID=A0A955L6W7_9BACT|nr:queuine tRNA-ribosyltransferase family protein [Candidatus Dojkabacteria bacterium]